ncbi:hypothetical protein Avbf_00512 [Armadillidium vulgare]|nr:hypothetical protein Avbf_00512 [Armadillidium vulgare]
MYLKLYLFLIIFILLKNSEGFPKISKNSNSESLLSIKNVNNIVDTVLPLFLKGPRDVVGRAKGSSVFKTLKDLKETMSKSVKSKEGWTSFGKRALTYFLTGKKALQNEKEVDIKLAHKLYEKSPEFVKDTVKAQLDGSVMPVLEKKVQEIIRTIKEKQATSSDDNLKVEGKQGTPFDPLVFGVNALINMFWFTTMIFKNKRLLFTKHGSRELV